MFAQSIGGWMRYHIDNVRSTERSKNQTLNSIIRLAKDYCKRQRRAGAEDMFMSELFNDETAVARFKEEYPLCLPDKAIYERRLFANKEFLALTAEDREKYVKMAFEAAEEQNVPVWEKSDVSQEVYDSRTAEAEVPILQSQGSSLDYQILLQMKSTKSQSSPLRHLW